MPALHSPSWEKPLKATIHVSSLMDKQGAEKVTGVFADGMVWGYGTHAVFPYHNYTYRSVIKICAIKTKTGTLFERNKPFWDTHTHTTKAHTVTHMHTHTHAHTHTHTHSHTHTHTHTHTHISNYFASGSSKY